MKALKGWRTLIFNIFAAILTVLIAFKWADILPPEYSWFAAFIVACGNAALRLITTTPAAQSTPFPQKADP